MTKKNFAKTWILIFLGCFLSFSSYAQLVASDDVFNEIYSSIGGSTTSVLNNDTLNGSPVVFSQLAVTMYVFIPNMNINPLGVITITSGTPAGIYHFSYQICEVTNPFNCDIAVATIQVLDSPCWDKFALGCGHTLAIKIDGSLSIVTNTWATEFVPLLAANHFDDSVL